MPNRASPLMLLPLITEHALPSCIAIPTHPTYIFHLMGDIEQAKSTYRYQPELHSLQFYDRYPLWLDRWPEGYPQVDINEWRLDHTVKDEHHYPADVVEFIEGCLWTSPTTKGEHGFPVATFHTWAMDECRVVVTQGGVNWLAYGDARAPGQGTIEVYTECIATEYLQFIPGIAGHLSDPEPR